MVYAQGNAKFDNWEIDYDKYGKLSGIKNVNSGNKYSFLENEYKGPSWYIETINGIVQPLFSGFNNNAWHFIYDKVQYVLEYKEDNGRLLIVATIRNKGNAPFQPVKVGLRLGIDTYMDYYPSWESKMFPTLLRCEKTHFWGYFMSPKGKILLIASPQPIASWSHEYSYGYGQPPYIFWGHRIESVNLDLINKTPLPQRHPQDLYQVLPNETKTFHIYIDEVNNVDQILEKAKSITSAPAIALGLTSCEKGDIFSFKVLSDNDVKTWVVNPDNKKTDLIASIGKKGELKYTFKNTEAFGIYKIYVESDEKLSEAIFYVRDKYSAYMQHAIKAVFDYPQRASMTHCEAWYGYYTAFAGGKYFPDNEFVDKANAHFDKFFPIVFDTISLVPKKLKHRIQNVSSIIGVLVDRYQLYNNESDLKNAIGFADFLIKSQTPDGAYRSGKTHYTSVIYIAKSLMELLEVIKDKDEYKDSYKKIFASVKLAIDELERNKTDVQTEGELTFEDGMISCTALQLALFALQSDDLNDKEKYIIAAKDIIKQHECLQQLVIPDARMRSGTARFWEAQYDVLMANNFLNSPHGWSSWATYANYYLYLLTGEQEYLIRTFNGLDAAMQMINIDNGELRWAFMVNPYINVTQITKNIDGASEFNVPGVHYNAYEYQNNNYVMGENYVDMVSDWFMANSNDNDVHEHFKCLEEIALNKAYICETDKGKFITFNCNVQPQGNKLIVTFSEDIINRLHVNFQNKYNLQVEEKNILIDKASRMVWINR